MKPSGKHLWLWPALLAGLFLAGPVSAFDLDSNQPIRVSADSARLDEAQGTAIYTGNVELTQGASRLDAAEVRLQRNEQGIRKIEATGSPAHYHQAQQPGVQATDARARDITWSADDNVVTFTGQAIIEQDGNTFRGDTIHYDSLQRVVTAEGGQAEEGSSGRVEMVIQPRTSSQPDSETGSDGSSQGQ